MIDPIFVVRMMAYLGAQQHASDTIDLAIRGFRESGGVSPEDRQAYGQVLFFCFFGGGMLASSKAEPDTKMLRKATEFFLSLLRWPVVEKYSALSTSVRISLGNAFFLLAQNKEQHDSDASLRSAIEEYRKVIAAQKAVGESPSLRDWGRLAQALKEEGVRDGGPAGISSLDESVAIYTNILYPYDPEHASLDWFLMQAFMAQSLSSLAQLNGDFVMACEAYARSIVAEHGCSMRSATFFEILSARDEIVIPVLQSVKTKFGERKTADCQAATREFLKAFGPS
jgi:hypothetical protein